MFANRKNQKLRLAVATQQSPVDFPHSSTFTLPGETEFPAPPAMPDALLRLDLCLSAFVVDLQDIKDIIRTDVGLTLQLLRLAARQTEQSPGRIGSIGEIAIQVGVPGLRELVSRTRALNFTSHAGLSVCERFWSHARLTALIAEELAGQSSEVDPEQAYLAG